MCELAKNGQSYLLSYALSWFLDACTVVTTLLRASVVLSIHLLIFVFYCQFYMQKNEIGLNHKCTLIPQPIERARTHVVFEYIMLSENELGVLLKKGKMLKFFGI